MCLKQQAYRMTVLIVVSSSICFAGDIAADFATALSSTA